MKKIGLIGGMGWSSTIDYYRIINKEANKKLGGLNAAEIIIYSLNFGPFMELQYANKWAESAQVLASAALCLKKAGADFILICSVTGNVAAKMVQKKIDIPIVSITELLAEEIHKKRLKKVLLLGTKVTMEYPFFSSELKSKGIKCVVPGKKDRKIIHDIIYKELCLNVIRKKSKDRYLHIIRKWQKKGIKGVILGCTEIPMLIKQKDLDIPVFDVTYLHTLKALKLAIEAKKL